MLSLTFSLKSQSPSFNALFLALLLLFSATACWELPNPPEEAEESSAASFGHPLQEVAQETATEAASLARWATLAQKNEALEERFRILDALFPLQDAQKSLRARQLLTEILTSTPSLVIFHEEKLRAAAHLIDLYAANTSQDPTPKQVDLGQVNSGQVNSGQAPKLEQTNSQDDLRAASIKHWFHLQSRVEVLPPEFGEFPQSAEMSLGELSAEILEVQYFLSGPRLLAQHESAFESLRRLQKNQRPFALSLHVSLSLSSLHLSRRMGELRLLSALPGALPGGCDWRRTLDELEASTQALDDQYARLLGALEMLSAADAEVWRLRLKEAETSAKGRWEKSRLRCWNEAPLDPSSGH